MHHRLTASTKVTFLIAGHETTGGTLSFAFYNLLKNPEVYRKAQEEVDRVAGEGPITVELVNKLQYLQAVCGHHHQTSFPTPLLFFFLKTLR